MFIPIKEEVFKISETDAEKMYWNEWIWNSHKWIEQHKGYYTCQFCNQSFTNIMPLGDNVKLCQQNQIIKERS